MSKPIIQVAAGIIRNEFGQLYLTQRLEGQDFAQALEFPGGKVDADETPEEALKRELEEEIGYTADLELLYDFYSAIGFCNERIKLYGATNLKKVENPRPQDADETLELLEVTLKEAKDLIQTGEICDAKTIMAIQYWDLINK